MSEFEATPLRGLASGDQYSDAIDQSAPDEPSAGFSGHPMDSPAMRKEHRRLLEWWYFEREKQAENRFQQSIDADYYDNLQWDPDDAEIVRSRGQMPLVYNEVAPMCDWLIGTERRTKADWKVLPRTEDDVQIADVKTKVLKYVADINRAAFARSRAFADAIKSGVGWVDDGVQDDPTRDILFSKYEDWRNVLWDSSSYELDLSDARYLFRWRWVDEDVALAMFPDRQAEIRRAIEDMGAYATEHEEDPWYLGEHLRDHDTGVVRAAGVGISVDAKRRKLKLIEAQYRIPSTVRVVRSGPLRGSVLSVADDQMSGTLDTAERVMMRVHFAVFTEASLLAWSPSSLRHNQFTLTPIWCYRRGRDRLPYGAIRRVRDIQQDLNKRASKALFMMNTNQIVADEGAVSDWDVAREEVDRPDGTVVKRPGKEFEIRRDTDAAIGQIQMMTLAAQAIQKSAGVNNENLGRQTNAVSGAAIEARQNQGAVGTTEPFDNLRYAIQAQGEKQLSHVEQFYSEEKVIRLSGARGKIDWIRINQPEMQPDGSVRWINDITASQADFVVADQDYAGTLRQAMFESLNKLATRLPPDVSLRLMTIAMAFSDLPNADEVADAIRKVTGERDESKPATPEDEARYQQQQQLLATQNEQAVLALEEQRSKVRKLNAEADKLEADANSSGSASGLVEELNRVRAQAAEQIDRLSDQLRKAHLELANRVAQIDAESKDRIEVARIDADAKVRVAEISKASDDKLTELSARVNALSQYQPKEI